MGMIVTIKTLQNQRSDIEIEPKDTVLQIKHKIKEQTNYMQGVPAESKLIHHGKILKNEEIAESVGLINGDFMVVMMVKHIGFQIDEKCYMDEIFKKYQIKRQCQTLSDFKSIICKSLKDDLETFEKYYDIFYENKPFDFGHKDFGEAEWWLSHKTAYCFDIKSKDCKLWYSQHYDLRCELLIFGYIRNETQSKNILVPIPIQHICQQYYHKKSNK